MFVKSDFFTLKNIIKVIKYILFIIFIFNSIINNKYSPYVGAVICIKLRMCSFGYKTIFIYGLILSIKANLIKTETD